MLVNIASNAPPSQIAACNSGGESASARVYDQIARIREIPNQHLDFGERLLPGMPVLFLLIYVATSHHCPL